MSIATCPACGAKNRIDESRADRPKCGRCGTPLPAAARTPTVVTDASFSADVLGGGSVPVLVDCWAAWCGPCRAVAPLIDQLAAESAGRWKITKLDTDKNPATAGRYQIDSIPTLLVFRDGKLVDKMVGAGHKHSITAMLAKWE